jgi:hypothetical protein
MARSFNYGWNPTGSSRVFISDISTNLTGTNTIGVWGEFSVPRIVNGLATHTLGFVEPRDERGSVIRDFEGRIDMDSSWHTARIVINTNVAAWSVNDTTPDRGVMAERIRHTFIHEIGHIFKLSHPNCTAAASMHQGYPNTAGGIPRNSPTVTVHDRNNMRAKWGA